MTSYLHELIAFYDAHPVPAAAVAMFVLAAFGIAMRAGARSVRQVRAGRSAEDLLTLLAALIATAVAMTGMWRFFGVVLHVGGPLRVLLFAFIEISVVTSAVRARRNMREFGTAGVDGAAVWALTSVSAVLSSMDARSIPEAVFRLAAPLVAAWLWERGMALERRRVNGRRIHWRMSAERILIRLGLAEPTGRTTSDVAAHRRLILLARAAKKVRVLRRADANPRVLRRAEHRLDTAMERAVEHAGLAVETDRQDALVAQLGALYNAGDLAELSPAAPWDRVADRAAGAGMSVTGLHMQAPPAWFLHNRAAANGNTAGPAHAEQSRTEILHTIRSAEIPRSAPGADQSRTNVPRSAPDRVRNTGVPPVRIDRATLVTELTEQIQEAIDAGRTWRPDYEDLIRRSGYRRRWCEEAVRDARNALIPAHDTDQAQSADDPEDSAPDPSRADRAEQSADRGVSDPDRAEHAERAEDSPPAGVPDGGDRS